MSPAHQFNDIHQHAKRELNPSPSNFSSSFPLKINKDSHFIKKSSSSPSSSSSSSSTSSLVNNGVFVANVSSKSHQQNHHQHQQQRQPVIIYTHSPKIIHTQPKDFMALVQKLTGLSRSDEDDDNDRRNRYNNHKPRSTTSSNIDDKKIEKGPMTMYDDNESTSVVTEDNNSGGGGGSSGCGSAAFGEAQVNSCFVPRPMFDPAAAAPNFNGIPFFNPSSTDFVSSSHHHTNNQPFYNYSSEDSTLFYLPNVRSSLSSSTLEGMKELPDF